MASYRPLAIGRDAPAIGNPARQTVSAAGVRHARMRA
jgi:hypothetical protein